MHVIFREDYKKTKELNKLNIQLLIANFTLNVSPELIDDIHHFSEYVENFVLSFDLKKYRPHRRPIVSETDEDGNIIESNKTTE
jgi:hypothetical protein